jgi:hypothetical protein
MGKTYASRGGRGPNQSAAVTGTPTIAGAATLGQTLTCTPVASGWPPPRFTFQWLRDAATTIAGATNPTYTIVAADQTHTLKCAVTAANDLGTGSAVNSAATGTIP